MSVFADFRFHHFGLAAANPDAAVAFAASVGYRCGAQVFDPLQNVYLHWCEHASAPSLEIVTPTGPDGPLKRILREQPSSFYHLCYEITTDAATALGQLRAEGLRVMTVLPPLPAVLFAGRMVSFHLVRGFGLVEFLELPIANVSGAS